MNRILLLIIEVTAFTFPPATYGGVAGPEVLQTEVVFVKVILRQTLHNHNIYAFNLPLTAETAPTSREKTDFFFFF